MPCTESSECMTWVMTHTGLADEIFEKWAAEHTEKTIADDFFEKFPNSPRDIYGLPSICARDMGYLRKCPRKLDDATTCNDCWRRPLEEAEG